MRHIIPISGKDSCATAVCQMARDPNLPYELFFNDVQAELPEVYEWLLKVERTLARPVIRVGVSLEELIRGHGILPSPDVRFCTRQGKIEPMERFIGDDAAIVYFGIRADEDRIGYVPLRHARITPVYPLKEMGIGLSGVYAILDKKKLMPPRFFWKSVHDIVIAKLDKKIRSGFSGRNYGVSLPDGSDILSKLPRWVFDSLFAWRTRSNCYFCFFQREYEWVGLLEHHPDLFEKAEQLEQEVGDDRQKTAYTWIRGKPLSSVRKNAKEIMLRRAARILKMLETRRFLHEGDLLTVTSCGLFCGK